MSVINVTNVEVLNNPTTFRDLFQFEISFECLHGLNGELEWKCIYVGSAESEKYDQVLESVVVGPIPPGMNKFLFEVDPPNPENIPFLDLLGVTVMLLTCSFKDKEFLRVGYYVTNEYDDPALNEEPPNPPLFEKIIRAILSSQPRVTWFQVDWASLLDEGDPNRGYLAGPAATVSADGDENDDIIEDEDEDEDEEEGDVMDEEDLDDEDDMDEMDPRRYGQEPTTIQSFE